MTQFIELHYTGRADGIIFDTTRQEDAPNSKEHLGPVVVKLGIGQLLPGLDAFLKDKQSGHYEVTLQPEEAFGKKDAKLLKLVPLTMFKKDKPEVGMSISIGEQRGVVKSISGGRVVIDFNHPLAGKTVFYSLDVLGVVDDQKKKVSSILKAMLGVQLPVEETQGKITITLPKGFPAEGLLKEIEKHTGVLVGIKEVELPEHNHEGHNHEGHEHHEHDGHNHHGHKH